MPIYEYQCARCGEVFEAFQRINDNPLTTCKFCGGPVEKLISHSSFQLKGSGWYLTDYAKKSGSGTPEPAATKSDKPGKSGDSSGTAATPTGTSEKSG